MPRPKTEVIFVKADGLLKEQVKQAAEALNQDLSSFVRDVLVEKLTRLRAENKAVAKALRQGAI